MKSSISELETANFGFAVRTLRCESGFACETAGAVRQLGQLEVLGW